MSEKKVGEITHYYDKIGVAVVKLAGTLKSGDQIRIETNDGDFKQTAESMQFDHKEIPEAKKGEEIGMKVDQAVKEGNTVYLVK